MIDTPNTVPLQGNTFGAVRILPYKDGGCAENGKGEFLVQPATREESSKSGFIETFQVGDNGEILSITLSDGTILLYEKEIQTMYEVPEEGFRIIQMTTPGTDGYLKFVGNFQVGPDNKLRVIEADGRRYMLGAVNNPHTVGDDNVCYTAWELDENGLFQRDNGGMAPHHGTASIEYDPREQRILGPLGGVRRAQAGKVGAALQAEAV